MWKSKDSPVGLMLRLLAITVAAGLILGLVHAVTAAPIEHQAELAATEARMAVLPDAEEFAAVDLTGMDTDIIQEVYLGITAGSPVGYTMSVETKGYSAGLNLTVGIDMDGVITGVQIGSHEETPGLGANATKPEFTDQYKNASGPFTVVKGGGSGGDSDAETGASAKAAEGAKEVQALTGATITSNAVTDAVNTVRAFFEEHLEGGA